MLFPLVCDPKSSSFVLIFSLIHLLINKWGDWNSIGGGGCDSPQAPLGVPFWGQSPGFWGRFPAFLRSICGVLELISHFGVDLSFLLCFSIILGLISPFWGGFSCFLGPLSSFFWGFKAVFHLHGGNSQLLEVYFPFLVLFSSFLGCFSSFLWCFSSFLGFFSSF